MATTPAPRYGPPPTPGHPTHEPHLPRPCRARWETPLRVALCAVVVACALGSAVAAFVALILYSGCFLGCSAPDKDPGWAAFVALIGLRAIGAGGWACRRLLRAGRDGLVAAGWLAGALVAAYAAFAVVVNLADVVTDAACTDISNAGTAYAYAACSPGGPWWLAAWAAALAAGVGPLVHSTRSLRAARARRPRP